MEFNKGFKILIVDDEVEYQRVVSFILKGEGYSVLTCSGGFEGLDILKNNEIDLVITDLKMPDMEGIELIQQMKLREYNCEIIVMTAFGSIESAVEAMKYGASGYFVKSGEPETLLADINRIAKIKSLEKSNQILKEHGIVPEMYLDTKSPAFEKVLNMCEKAADTSINILLLGESGVGKEVVANYIHNKSNRKSRHFVAANCQVFADGMVESELFGHEKGAFTGAVSKRIGRFEEANYGTLFLDEIGDLPINTQGKLLRSLESRSIERVGSNRNIELDIRLISATNKDLDKEIKNGTFREDLLYRINTLTITIPPLRERKEDLKGLIEYFLSKIQKEQKKIIKDIDENVMKFLSEYDYPGNIRELKNILERLVALSENGVIRNNGVQFQVSQEPEEVVKLEVGLTLREARARFEARYIAECLKQHGGNVSKTSDSLAITQRQLWNKISEYDIKR